MNDFWAKEASLSVVMLAYNLMSIFRQMVLKVSTRQSQSKDVQNMLKTLRYKLFAKAGYLGTEGRARLLKLAVAMHPSPSSRVDRGLMESCKNLCTTRRLFSHFRYLAGSNENLGLMLIMIKMLHRFE